MQKLPEGEPLSGTEKAGPGKRVNSIIEITARND
jgi:hypothetical protein